MPHLNRIKWVGYLILLLLLGCNPREAMMDLEHENRKLETELNRERYVRWRLQAYIDSTLGGGSEAFLEKIKAYEPLARTDTLVVRDTVQVERPVLREAAHAYPEADRLEQKLKALLGALLGHRITLRRAGDEVTLVVEEKMLFEPEKARLTADGKAVLKKLGKEFAQFPDMLITVEGHIDAPKLQPDADSWEMSLTRALSVTRGLLDGGVKDAQIRVAGRGAFVPVDDNKKEAGRYLNRRTEIILRP